MSDDSSYDRNEGVAIVGMTGRFPGARDVHEFWRNLERGVESITRFAADEMDLASPEEMAGRDEPGYVAARGILPDEDLFDAAFFGMAPTEAAVVDPQQRLFLEAAWEALETAGYDPHTYTGAIGVFAGMTNNTYFPSVLSGRPDATARVGSLQTMMGNEKDYLATRVAYKLNLRGPALNVQTACSTSLVAVCQAVQSLLTYGCDMALAGGVSVVVPQKRGYLYTEGAITSPDGHCRPFDVEAAGTVFSNGLGIVVLKRLAEAVAEGDTIYAVIKGAALNNDGSAKVSFTAPSVEGQAEVVALAQALAGIHPDTIGYVEAHGTGTALGDPIEVAALTKAFRRGTARRGYCALASLKGNVGHLDAAAGVAGLIKVALALHEKAIPASLHFHSPNPKLGLDESPFFVCTSLRPWPEGDHPRRAGLSSLGTGGTNAHVVLEEGPRAEPRAYGRQEQVLLLSARTEAALDQASARLRAHLDEHPDASLADVAYTLQVGRHRFDHRRAVVCAGREEAVALLGNPGATRVVTGRHEARGTPVVFLFPGQGAQHVDMGRRLYEAEPTFRSEVDDCAEVLRPHLGADLREILYPSPDRAGEAQARIVQTAITQPALFAIEYALAKTWMEWGVEPEAMAGHSLGEYVAACLAGVFSRDDALVLLARRGRLMQELPSGSMLAVRAAARDVEPLLGPEVSLAGLNASNLTVVSGEHGAVSAIETALQAQGIAAKRLETSHAFHSPMMDPIVGRFAELVRDVPRQAPSLPFLSSLTGDWITDEEATDPGYWGRQLRAPVRFAEGVARLASHPDSVLLEVGPGRTLSSLVRSDRGRPASQAVVTSLDAGASRNDDVLAMLMAAGRLWIAGVDLDWEGHHHRTRRVRVPLPTYPFERKRHWVEPAAAPAGSEPTRAAAARPVEHAARPQSTKDEESMSHSIVEAGGPSARRASLVVGLQQMFSEMAGIESRDLDPAASLLELGLDSLFLTQASTKIQRTFGVRIAFRELLDEATSMDSLAARIDADLPAEAPPAARLASSLQAAPAGTRSPAHVSSAPVHLGRDGRVEADTVLERVLAQQLEIMSRQLDMLQGRAVSAPIPDQPIGEQGAAQAVSPSPSAPQRHGRAAEAGTVAFGPYRPPAKGPTGGLTPTQERGLADLVERYTRRTAGSKQLAADNRPHLADPRTVAGFRLMWKEMVYPIVTVRSAGSKLWDVDGNEYVDLTNGFGMILFGHNPPFVREAIEAQLRQGIEIGPQTPLAGEVARLMTELTGAERVAFCNTGSEAVTAAIRVARTVTGRDKIAMFTGAYHGVFDEVLVRPVGTGSDARSMPIAPGIPSSMVDNILVLEYGAQESLRVLEARGAELAAVLVEPVQSRRPELQPVDFLRRLREVTEKTQTALVFDEVVTGFRVHPGGTQAAFGIRADIATYGKVVGGGLPIGLVAGRAAYLDALDGGQWRYGDESFPEVGVTFFAGTFVRHPMALAAARAVLLHLKSSGPDLQRDLNLRTARLVDELNACAEQAGAPVRLTHFSSWFCFNFPQDVPHASLFYAWMRAKGVHVWEGRAGFLTTAHTDADLAHVRRAFEESIREMQDAGFLPKGEARPPVPGARLGRDGQGNEAWFVPDPERPGKYLQVEEEIATRA